MSDHTLVSPDARARSATRPRGTSFAGLVGVELRRLWWRRMTKVALLGVVLFTGLSVFTVYQSTSPETLAQQLDGYNAQVEQFPTDGQGVPAGSGRRPGQRRGHRRLRLRPDGRAADEPGRLRPRGAGRPGHRDDAVHGQRLRLRLPRLPPRRELRRRRVLRRVDGQLADLPTSPTARRSLQAARRCRRRPRHRRRRAGPLDARRLPRHVHQPPRRRRAEAASDARRHE